MLTRLFRSPALMTGLAMFSMFFGAGNIIFPLAIGYAAQDQTLFAVLGLLITAVLIPFMGLIAMILFDGHYQNFFGCIGRIPGLILALSILTLLGPLGSTPRCIALAYSTFKMSFPNLSAVGFSAGSCLLIFFFAVKKNRMLGLLGYVLTPLLLLSLGIIIIKGFMTPGEPQIIEAPLFETFMHGLKEGYNTMDLLAAFFFSAVVLQSLKKRIGSGPDKKSELLKTALQSSCIGAILLGLTYVGFSYLAAKHGSDLMIMSDDQLLGSITMKIIGPSAGFWVNLTIALACLTTAIALVSVFADFLQTEIFRRTVGYETLLGLSLIVTFIVATFEFSGISAFLGPILQTIYPALIALTCFNLVYAFKVSPLKSPSDSNS